jgi:2-keto-3-deoxy-L-fuconate dehydrogenase
MMCQAVWPVFVQAHAGVIINVASIMGQVGGVGAPAYCASKAGVVMLSRCLAKDGAGAGIRVNSICPGYIDTPIMDRMLAAQPDPVAARRDILARQPLGRLGSPEDISHAALFLASKAASFISGTELTIDGAVTATQID